MFDEPVEVKDTVLITEEFVKANNEVNKYTQPNTIWKVGETARVCEIDDVGQVRLIRGVWSTWVTLPLVRKMRYAYLHQETNQNHMEY